MSKLRSTEVFTPGAFPLHTYVERSDRKYEERLRDALEIPGQVVSISGPSKSGKTVLVERVVSKDNLITITGAGITQPSDLWNRILDWMDVPIETSKSRTKEGNVSASGGVKGGAGIPFLAKGEASAGIDVGIGTSSGSSRVYHRGGMEQVVSEIANSDFVLLIDDFHYMPRPAQEEIAKQIKEAVRRGVKIVTASVPHRSDDVVRANPELRGRVMAIDLEYWDENNLMAIANRGFELLGASLNPTSISDFVREAAGIPQLMQAICLNACFELGIRESSRAVVEYMPSQEQRQNIFERTAATTDFRSLVDVLDSGPMTRGTERKEYSFSDNTKGDVYRCILKAVSSDPPKLSFPYDEIQSRIRMICMSDEPVGSSVIGSCLHMSKLAAERFPRERVVDWDEQKLVLDITDPYLLFYLRWSGRLLEPEH